MRLNNNLPANRPDRLRQLIHLTALLAVVLLLGYMAYHALLGRPNQVTVSADDHIELTPIRVEQLRDIGQWEFLSIADEELIDTIRKGFFSDDHLVRIYYGTLRLGFDMKDTRPGWATAHGDTVALSLPRITLLDENFIDEARTESFFESGKWSAKDRQALARRAHSRMKARCLTPANTAQAETNARSQLMRMFSSMGYSTVEIKFE